MQKENTKNIHSNFWSNIFDMHPERDEMQSFFSLSPIFTGLSGKDLSYLIGIMHNRSYIAGEFIFYQGDPGIGIYFIRSGEVTIQRNVLGIENYHVASLQKGDFFGELALVDGEKRSASAVAKTDVQLSVIFKPDLDEFIDKYPKKGIKILQRISTIITTRLRLLNEEHITLQIKTKNKPEKNYGT